MKFEFSCRGCENRYPGCHGSCETYKQERIAYDKQKEELDRQRETWGGVYGQRARAVEKAYRRNKRRGYGYGKE